MIRKKQGEIEWLEFELLQRYPSLRHAVFLRHGGVSEGPFSSLNISRSVGDNPSSVFENRTRICRVFGCSEFWMGHQVHGVSIQKACKGLFLLESCDGLFTQEKGRPLLIQHADCQAAIFYDPVNNMLANIHCGWRGSVQNIYQKTVDLFRLNGSHPSNILVCISPSLGPLASEFIHFKNELPEEFWAFRRQEVLFDFWQISAFQLEQAGILSSHIEIASICTHANQEDYFSYRRGRVTGRHATLAQLV